MDIVSLSEEYLLRFFHFETKCCDQIYEKDALAKNIANDRYVIRILQLISLKYSKRWDYVKLHNVEISNEYWKQLLVNNVEGSDLARFKWYSCILLEGLRTTTKNFNQGVLWPGWNSNRSPAECKSRALSVLLTFWVDRCVHSLGGNRPEKRLKIWVGE
jgi:hypothetical protein